MIALANLFNQHQVPSTGLRSHHFSCLPARSPQDQHLTRLHTTAPLTVGKQMLPRCRAHHRAPPVRVLPAGLENLYEWALQPAQGLVEAVERAEVRRSNRSNSAMTRHELWHERLLRCLRRNFESAQLRSVKHVRTPPALALRGRKLFQQIDRLLGLYSPFFRASSRLLSSSCRRWRR